MEVFSVLVTGANRGIGLEFVRQLSGLPKPPTFIFATYRSSEKLKALEEIKSTRNESNIVLIKMDVTNHDEVVEARKIIEQKVGDSGLTFLINNAGAVEPVAFPNLTEENLLYHFKINTIGPIRVLQEMLPLLKKASTHNAGISGMRVARAAVLNMSSMAGSIARTGVEFLQDLAAPGYKISKAGLNMAMRVIAAQVKNDNILVVMMCPGWVKTDMGTDMAQITPEESIAAMIETLQTLDESYHGIFMDRNGIPYAF